MEPLPVLALLFYLHVQVIVLWTANTERFCDVREGLNDTADSLLESIRRSEAEVSPSTVFAVASILEGCCYINGSPQNTFVPGVIELAERHGVFIGGDDFKSGQTKLKSVLVDFLVKPIKPRSIVSYNYLGNNDGQNLSVPKQFRSKEVGDKPYITICIKNGSSSLLIVSDILIGCTILPSAGSSIFIANHNTTSAGITIM